MRCKGTILSLIHIYQKFYTSVSKNLMQNVNFGFMKMSKKSFTLCGIAAVVFILSLIHIYTMVNICHTGG